MIQQIFDYFSGAGEILALFIVSIIPFIELRGAIPFGILALGMPWYEVLLVSFIANCLPIPFIILLARPVVDWLKRTKLFSGFAHKLEAKMMKKSKKITKYEMIGLFLFVVIPLPGTGAYSGALIAALLGMRLRKSFIAIAAGVFLAGVIVTILSLCGLLAFL